MNVNLHLTGELEGFVNDLVERGMAANKTDAIRLAIARYYEEQQRIKKKVGEEPMNQSTIEAHWNNPSDEKASEFYLKRYLHEKA
jgi:Arc/MetJ-type ribon-helix-helix transcriptional regulator